MASLAKLFDTLGTRERWLALATCGFILYAICESLLWTPLRRDLNTLLRESARLESDIASLQTQIKSRKKLLSEDPDLAVRQRVETLQRQVRDIRNQVGAIVNRQMVENAESTEVLEFLVRNLGGLEIISLSKAEPVARVVQSDSDAASFYLHPIEVELSGTYAEFEAFVDAISDGYPAVALNGVEINADGYPQNHIVLRLAVLASRTETLKDGHDY